MAFSQEQTYKNHEAGCEGWVREDLDRNCDIYEKK